MGIEKIFLGEPFKRGILGHYLKEVGYILEHPVVKGYILRHGHPVVKGYILRHPVEKDFNLRHPVEKGLYSETRTPCSNGLYSGTPCRERVIF